MLTGWSYDPMLTTAKEQTLGRLDGKVAMVTGGARGQGEAEVRLFAAQGARVVVSDVLVEAGDALARELGDRVAFTRHDVSSEEDGRRR